MCSGAEACRAATQAIVDAISWRVRAELLELAAARLSAVTSSSEAIVAHLTDGSFDAWYASDKAAYLGQVRDHSLAGLRDAAAAVAVLAQHSPDAQLFVAPLQAKVTRAEAAAAAGKPLPGADPIVAGGGDATTPGGALTPPGVVKLPFSCACDLARSAPPSTNGAAVLVLAALLALTLARRVRD